MSAKRKNRKHSLSEKLKAIELYKSGYGNTIIGRRLNIEASSVKYWIRVYKNKGCLGLEKQSYNQIKRETKRTKSGYVPNSVQLNFNYLSVQLSGGRSIQGYREKY